MTPRERVHQALRFETTAIVPYHVLFTAPAKRKLAAFLGDPEFERKLGNHLATLSHRRAPKWTEVSPGHFADEWGVVWNRTLDEDIGVVANRVLPEASLQGYHLPPPAPAELLAAYPPFVAEHRDQFRMASLGLSLFERAWTLRGMDQLLMDMVESPRFVHELFEALVAYNLAQVEIALGHDVDGVYFGDDWGSQSGLIMGPRRWRELIKPHAARMYARVREAGKCVCIHCCGDVKEILPDLVEIGVQVFNPFQPETMDVVETKRRYQGRLAFWGGISVQHLLPHGTPEEVRRETLRLLAELGEGGGYIAAPSHAVTADVPAENMVALLETLQSQ